MGMAATQSRLLNLTTRQSDIKYNMLRLTTDNAALVREMDNVQRKYRNSLNAKTFKYTLDGGANYTDLTYKTLMYPSGVLNDNKLNLLTDMNGKVVLDNKYADAAKLISPDGSPANWEAHRWEFLEQLTGIDKDTIENAEKNYKIFIDDEIALDILNAREPDRSGFIKANTAGLIKKLDNIDELGGGWYDMYKDNEEIDRNDIPEIMDMFKNNLADYFLDDDKKELFQEACDTVKTTTAQPGTMKELVDYLLGVYKGLGGLCSTNQQGDSVFVWYDIDSNSYDKYVDKHEAWQNEVDALTQEMENAINDYNSALNAEARTLLTYYENLGQSIAEKGWVFNGQVNDQEYLNNMLMNNMFFITEVKTELLDSDSDTLMYKNIYDQQTADGSVYLVKVNDTAEKEKALMEYEHEKSRIQNKETKNKNMLNNYETELASIKQMIESYQNIINKNVDRYYKIFSA